MLLSDPDARTSLGVLIFFIFLFGVGFAVGRHTAPVQIKKEIVTVEVEKKTSSTDKEAKRAKHKKTVVHEFTHPDGTKETITTTTEDTESEKSSNHSETDDTSKSSSSKTEVVRNSSPVTISALGGIPLSGMPQVIYGASISKPILGPVTLGAFGLSNGVVGGSLGLTF